MKNETDTSQNNISTNSYQGQKSFRGIWIPKVYLEDMDLGIQEQLVLSMILGLSNNEKSECTASNGYFASLLDLSVRRIQQIISKLSKKGYLTIRKIIRDGTKNFSVRGMKITSPPSRKKFHPYIIEDNKTFIENISPEMKQVFDMWISYRKEMGKPLFESSQNASFDKLIKLSNGDHKIARQIVQQTIENGWQSLQPIKKVGSGNKKLRPGMILKTNNYDNFEDVDF